MHYLCRWVNEGLHEGKFPDSLKLAVVNPIHKKEDPFTKDNYRRISILFLVSKIFQRIIYNQFSGLMTECLNKLLCSFSKAHSTQHALFKLLHSWQQELDKSSYVGAILMELSNASDSSPLHLIIEKLEAYGFDRIGLKLFYLYLSNVDPWSNLFSLLIYFYSEKNMNFVITG